MRVQSSSSQAGTVHELVYGGKSLPANLIASVGLSAWVELREIAASELPFLTFKYHIGFPNFTCVFVTHSRSESGTLQVLKCILAALVGSDWNKGRNFGKNGKISLGWRLLLSVPISST